MSAQLDPFHTLLEVKNLAFEYHRGPRFGPVSFEIRNGEAFGLVGTSGAGKTTLALALMDALHFKGGRRTSGKIHLFCRKEQVIYIPQDPMAAMDPLFTVGDQMRELGCSRRAVLEILEKMGMPLEHFGLEHYPHELSGGMLQRFLIAMALARNPQLLIADEPTASLDVIHQAEILRLFQVIRNQGVAIIYITHQIPVAMSICSRIAVLYEGDIIELEKTREIYKVPQKPFTQKLIKSVPMLDFT